MTTEVPEFRPQTAKNAPQMNDESHQHHKEGQGRGGEGRKHDRGSGRGGRSGANQYRPVTAHHEEMKASSSQFFEDRRHERYEFESPVHSQPSNSAKTQLAAGASNDQRLWSRKLDQKKGNIKLTKGLGSTANYLGDIDDGSYLPKREEKVAIVEDPAEEEKRLAAKDKAIVKYNY